MNRHTSNIIPSSLSTNEVNVNDEALFCHCGNTIMVQATISVSYKFNKTSNKFELVWSGDTIFDETEHEGTVLYCSKCWLQYENCECQKLETVICKCKHMKKSHRYSELFSNTDNEAVYMECSICKCAEFEELKN